MKKSFLLLAILLQLSYCQSADTAEPVVSKLRSLGRYTGWGWSYRGYHQTCNAYPLSGSSWSGLARSVTSPPELETADSFRAAPYVSWLPDSSQRLDELPARSENYPTSIAELPLEKRQIVQPTR